MPADDRLQVPREFDRGEQLQTPDRVHLHHGELVLRERAGLVQDLVRHAHLPQVVEVGTEADRRLAGLVEPEDPRHGHRVLRHALAMAEGVAVRGLDRLPPLEHHREVGGFQLGHLAADVHEVYTRVEPAEQTVGGVQQRERFLVPPHRLIQQRQLARRLRFVQHGAGAHRQLDRRAETRFGERGAPRLAVHHAEDAVGLGLVAAGVELVENGEGSLGVAPGVLVAPPHDVHLGVIHQALPLQVRVARPLGDLVALLEVALGSLVLPEVGVRDPQVGIRDRATVLVIRGPVRLEGTLVVRDRLVQVPLDVRHDAEVLLDPGAQLAALTPSRQRLEEVPARVLDRAGLHVQPAERVQRFRGQQVVAGVAGHAVAAATQLARFGRLVAEMAHDRHPTQRLSQDRPLPGAVRRGDRRVITPDRLGNTRGPLVGTRVVQQVRRGARGRARTRLPGRHHAMT